MQRTLVWITYITESSTFTGIKFT